MILDFTFKLLLSLKKVIQTLKPPGGFKVWMTLICFGFIGFSILSNLEKLSQQSITRDSLFCLISGLILSWISILINAIAWEKLIFWLGYQSKGIHVVSLYLTTNILKYLPGGIWHFLERFRSLRKYMKSDIAIYSVLLEPFFMIIAALCLVSFGGFNLFVKVFCFLPLFIFSNKFRTQFISFLSKLKISNFRRIDARIALEPLSGEAKISAYGYPYQVVLTEILFITLRFAGFWFCLNAFSIHNSLNFTDWLSAFSLAWIVGLSIPSAPGGVGVFEAFLLLILRDSVPEIPLLSALLYYRLIVTLADLLAWVFAPDRLKLFFAKTK